MAAKVRNRALQMVCRLLAYNAELDLARALNDYLQDQDEYRAITRNLLHQPGTIAYCESSIEVPLRSPDAPRIARRSGCSARSSTRRGRTSPATGDRSPIGSTPGLDLGDGATAGGPRLAADFGTPNGFGAHSASQSYNQNLWITHLSGGAAYLPC